MSIVFQYKPSSGAVYARNFALHSNIPDDQRLFYYEKGANCTNFISQCVWAAYGGWIPGFSQKTVSENLQRIKKDIRQVRGLWYGSASNIGSEKWCRVVDFYNYVTDENKELGPRAKVIAEGTFEAVDPSLIETGDVVQAVVTTYRTDNYGHGLYVTAAGSTFMDITVCSNSDDRLDETMSFFAERPEIYKKIRVLRFQDAIFKN